MIDAYVVAGYGVTLAALGGYALRVLRRERVLSRAETERGASTAASEERP